MIASALISHVMLKSVVLIATVVVVAADDGEVSRLVKTTQGLIRGYKAPEEKLFAFHGIPYATAPVGPNKFKAALPPPTWTSTFEATNKEIICPQMQSFLNLENKIQQEDCLIANIYVPDSDSINMPVVVYVHGGAFQMGYGNLMTAKQLMAKKDMVVVNFNYRLGAHGFLCLGTKDVPGNAGMKDQVALLRWVRMNIASFGGNPEDVTLIGYSAGSSAVDLLLLSSMAKGLFHRVIPESGASLSSFSIQSDPIEVAWRYAKMLNFTNTKKDISDLENLYKTMPFETMFSVDVINQADSTFFLSPCVEIDIGQDRFLDDAPLNILKNGKNQKVPMLFGFAEMEGLFRIPVFDNWKEQMNQKFSDFLPVDLKFSTNEEKDLVAQKVKNFYFGEQPVNENTIFRYIDYFTDVIFSYGTLKSAKLQILSGNKDVYLYEYSFVDDNTPLVPYTQVRGANHCSQSMSVADGIQMFNQNSTTDTEDMKIMKDSIRELWVNFISTGKPVPEGSALPAWPSADANGGPHMSLDKSMKLRGPLLQQRVLFWDSIYEKYYRMPIPPTVPLRKNSEL